MNRRLYPFTVVALESRRRIIKMKGWDTRGLKSNGQQISSSPLYSSYSTDFSLSSFVAVAEGFLGFTRFWSIVQDGEYQLRFLGFCLFLELIVYCSLKYCDCFIEGSPKRYWFAQPSSRAREEEAQTQAPRAVS